MTEPVIDIWRKSDAHFAVVVRKFPVLMHRMNRLSGRYPADVEFLNTDEPVFFFENEQAGYVKQALGTKYWPALIGVRVNRAA